MARRERRGLRAAGPGRLVRVALAGLGISFGALLAIGGARVMVDPVMRPPRLPHRRPPAWALPLAGTGLVAASRLSLSTRLSSRLTTPLLLVLATPGAGAVVFEMIRMANGACQQRKYAGENGPDSVVVLGCALIDNEPSELLRRRLFRALEVAGPDTRAVVMSGGIGNDTGSDATRSEAAAMAEWVSGDRGWGGFRGRIIEEPLSTNTAENIDLSRRALAEALGEEALGEGARAGSSARQTVVVSSDFHVLRVRKLLRDRGLGTWHVAGAYTPARYWATSTLREFLAQFVLWLPRGSARILSISAVGRARNR
nr:YdcF family protein [Corynebacterium lactis]